MGRRPSETLPRTSTPRRSQRFQPLPLYVPEEVSQNETLEGQISSRQLRKGDLQDVNSEEPGTAIFYNSFRRSSSIDVAARTKSTKKGKEKATTGDVVFRIGDPVLVDVIGNQKSIGVITELWEAHLEDNESEATNVIRKYARVHWFLRPSQLPKVREKREHEENEIYYTASSESRPLLLPLILAHCALSSAPRRPSSDPKPKRPRFVIVRDDHEGQTFVCYKAINQFKGSYHRFNWEETLNAGKTTGNWNLQTTDTEVSSEDEDHPKKRTSRGTKRKHEDTDDESEDEEEGDEYQTDQDEMESGEDNVEEDDAISRSPSPSSSVESASPSRRKRRKVTDGGTTRSKTRTPRKSRITFVEPTPNSKAALAKRALKAKRKVNGFVTPTKRRIRPLRSLSLSTPSKWTENLPKDPHLRALATLHVSATPDDLPCRSSEFEDVLGAVEGLLEEGTGGCVYISGVPGTGKTATVHAVVRTLHERAQASEIPPFTFLPLNGLKLTDAREAYVELWRVVSDDTSGRKVGSAEALRRLVGWFEQAGRNRGPDSGSFVVLMDELDQLITVKQDVVYNFFNWPTLPGSRLVVIAVANTMDLPERVMSGKVRSRLGMRRINFQPYTKDQLMEIVFSRLGGEDDSDSVREAVMDRDAVQLAAMKVAAVSGDARRILDICRRAVEFSRLSDGKWPPASLKDVSEVVRQMQNSPAAAYLRDCSFMEKVMLVAVVKVIRREGVSEVRWGDVTYQHHILVTALGSVTAPPPRASLPEQRMVLSSLLASHALLFEEGALASRKAEDDRKVCLGLESGEIERVLGDWGGDRWKTMLGL